MNNYTADFWSRQGAKLRASANDIKRNAEALAVELGEKQETIDAIFAGIAPPEVFDRVIRRMADIYPLSRVDLEVKRDDTEDGAVVRSPEQCLASSRVFARDNASGQLTPFYEYRDAAMSSVGPYRPEWIKTLRVISSDDPEDPDVAYNNGHLMHQMTFFVGPVNFYWKVGDHAHVAKMSTGDSNYITPFIAHSYTSRDASQEAYIIAVTFEGKLQNIQQELAVLDADLVVEELLDLTDRQRAFSGILRRELANSMLARDQLSAQVEIDSVRLETLLDGHGFPSQDELARISVGLGTNIKDLLPPENIDPKEVVVKHSSPDQSWYFPSAECPSYQVEDLAGSRKVPYTKAMAVRVLEPVTDIDGSDFDLVAPAHEFAYNYGTETALLRWKTPGGFREAAIEPGGSYYLKPAIPHSLRSLSRSRPSDMVIVRVGGSLQGDAHLELSSLPREAVHRVFRETRQWYDPKTAGA